MTKNLQLVQHAMAHYPTASDLALALYELPRAAFVPKVLQVLVPEYLLHLILTHLNQILFILLQDFSPFPYIHFVWRSIFEWFFPKGLIIYLPENVHFHATFFPSFHFLSYAVFQDSFSVLPLTHIRSHTMFVPFNNFKGLSS